LSGVQGLYDRSSILHLAPEDLIHCGKDPWRDKDKLDSSAVQKLLARESAAKKAQT
jgi:hypothetical protein